MAITVGEQGKVFAFEPLPGNCELIKLSVEANNLTNLELFPDAAGNAVGTINIIVDLATLIKNRVSHIYRPESVSNMA